MRDRTVIACTKAIRLSSDWVGVGSTSELLPSGRTTDRRQRADAQNLKHAGHIACIERGM